SSGRNKVAIHFSDFNMANTTLSHPSLKEAGLSAFIPSLNILRTGVIRSVPLDILEDDITKQTVLVKFREQFLPRSVSFLYVSFPVSPYIPRVLMCFSCLRYGHVIADCKSRARCERCGNAKHPTPDDCPRIQLPPLCCNCGGEHLPSASICPAFLKQKQIYACAATENISYVAARFKLGGSPPPSTSPPPNVYHPSEFPPFSQPHNPSRPLISYQDLIPETSPPLNTIPNRSKSFAAALNSSSSAFANGLLNSPPSRVPSTQASTSASLFYHNSPSRSNNNNTKSSTHYVAKDNMPHRDIHNSFLFAPNGRMPSSSSPPIYNFSDPHSDPPPASSSPSSPSTDGFTNFIQGAISFLLKILDYIPSALLNSLFGPSFQRVINFLQSFLNNNALSTLH
ncbi:hypothetical protein ALC62_02858, partial [Cyphomyrmex costatus]